MLPLMKLLSRCQDKNAIGFRVCNMTFVVFHGLAPALRVMASTPPWVSAGWWAPSLQSPQTHVLLLDTLYQVDVRFLKRWQMRHSRLEKVGKNSNRRNVETHSVCRRLQHYCLIYLFLCGGGIFLVCLCTTDVPDAC